MIPLSRDFPPEPQDCIFASTPYLLPPLSYKTHSFRLMQFYHTFCPFPVSIINEMKAFVCWLSLPLHEKETLPSAWRTSVFHQNPALQFPGLLVPSNLFTSNSDMHNQIVTIHNCCTLSPSTIAVPPKTLIQVPCFLSTAASPPTLPVHLLPTNSALAS